MVVRVVHATAAQGLSPVAAHAVRVAAGRPILVVNLHSPSHHVVEALVAAGADRKGIHILSSVPGEAIRPAQVDAGSFQAVPGPHLLELLRMRARKMRGAFKAEGMFILLFDVNSSLQHVPLAVLEEFTRQYANTREADVEMDVVVHDHPAPPASLMELYRTLFDGELHL